MNGIEVKSINDFAELERLRPVWNDLFENSIRPDIFGSWEWQSECARLSADPDNLVVLTAYDHNRLIGLLPLKKTTVKTDRLFSTDTLSCLGGGITDYNAFLVRTKYLSGVIPAITRHLIQNGMTVSLENVLPGTPLYLLTQYMVANGFRSLVHETKTTLQSDLGADYDSFCKGLKQKFRRNLNNNRNRMNRDGRYSFHTESPGDTNLTELIRLHTARWEHKGEAGVLARKRIRTFHRALQKIENRSFDIKYFLIRHDQDIIAVVYGFLLKNCFYAYLSGFDMAHNRISPGNMVFDYCVRELIDDGISRLDFLRGDMKYKKSWATRTLTMKDRFLFPPNLSGRLRHFSARASLTLRGLLPRSVKKGLSQAVNGLSYSKTESDFRE